MNNPSTSHSEELYNLKSFEYTVKWPENIDSQVLKSIKNVSLLVEQEKYPPPSYLALRSRILEEIKIIKQSCYAFGYYDAEVEYKIKTHNKVKIVFSIDLKKAYKIESVNVRYIGKFSPEIPLPKNLPRMLYLKIDQNVDASKVQEAQQILLRFFMQYGYPFAKVSEPEAELNFKEHTAKITFPVKLHGLVKIQQTHVKPIESLDDNYVKNRIFWSQGDIFDASKVDRTKRNLVETSIFDSLSITPIPIDEETIHDNDEVPVIMDVNAKTAPPRSIIAGARYATSRGAQLHAGWTHYNIDGMGSKVGATITFSQKIKKIHGFHNIPDFLRPRQNLENTVTLEDAKKRPYSLKTVGLRSSIHREVSENLIINYGVTSENGNTVRKHDERKISIELIGIPFGAKIDTTNSLLNPTRGFRLSGDVVAYTGKLDDSKGMAIVNGEFSFYLPFDRFIHEDRGTIASFIKVGAIRIRDGDDIPPNKKFYAGGDHSMRGYGYQLVGPVDKNRIPLGGQSLLEFGTEARYKFTDTIGGVIFVEGGNVFDNTNFGKNKDLLWSTGFGVRYYTDFAPIRADIAFPLKRRKLAGSKKSYDNFYQFYISIGQAF